MIEKIHNERFGFKKRSVNGNGSEGGKDTPDRKDEKYSFDDVRRSRFSTRLLLDTSRSTWDYLGKFFTGFLNGYSDYLSLLPQNIDLAANSKN